MGRARRSRVPAVTGIFMCTRPTHERRHVEFMYRSAPNDWEFIGRHPCRGSRNEHDTGTNLAALCRPQVRSHRRCRSSATAIVEQARIAWITAGQH